jgi:hypothetical protein
MYLYIDAGPNQKGERALGKGDCSKQTKNCMCLDMKCLTVTVGTHMLYYVLFQLLLLPPLLHLGKILDIGTLLHLNT